jgi:ABC-2 type transport system permease protein
MKKIWLVTSITYRERLRSGMFLILTFAIPFLMIVAGAVGFFSASSREAEIPNTIGYVDQTGRLVGVAQVVVREELLDIDENLLFTAYPTLEAARQAYLQGQTGGYLLIPEGYFSGDAVTYYTDDDPGVLVNEGLRLFLRRSLLEEQPEWVFERLGDPATYTYVNQETGETVAEGPGLVLRLAAPAFLAAVFVLAVLFGTNQMGAAIIREKEQRSIEMVITSLRPLDLVAGKVFGMTLLSLTQFAIWTLGAIVALYLAYSDRITLGDLPIPWSTLLLGVLLIIPGYFLFALLAAGLGIIAGDEQQAQQLAGIVSFLGLAPIYLLGAVLANPDSSLAVVLTLFPLTSPSVGLVRTAFTEVPVWQFVAAIVILLASLALSLIFVTRVFRAAMLNYGKALRPRQVWSALLQA